MTRSFSGASPATQALKAISNEVANVGMKLTKGVELFTIDAPTNMITLKLIMS